MIFSVGPSSARRLTADSSEACLNRNAAVVAVLTAAGADARTGVQSANLFARQ
jgi:hypothetical protein